MFERFSDDARAVVVHAQEESQRLGQRHIGSEHLLLGLLHDPVRDVEALGLLAVAGVTLAGVRDRLAQYAVPPVAAGGIHVPFTDEAKDCLDRAGRTADRFHRVPIGPLDVLLGLLTNQDNGAVRLVRAVGADVQHLTAVATQAAAGRVGTATNAASDPQSQDTGPVPRRRREDQEDDGVAHVRRLMRTRQRYVDALRRYGRHEIGCDPSRCSCGLATLLDEADGI